MIKVEIENNKIEIKGHANYDDYGKDIVCASVSSIVITTINAIIEFDPESIYYEDLNNRILIEKLKDDDITNKLINNMIELLEELEESYKDNIKIIRR
ncbi:MAG TPA: ribosomal-processing cysteine protease Prp [Firmicutes bacterium]|nr:ribosomal-processing cysteine protease Prp [Bacillota bacterium]